MKISKLRIHNYQSHVDTEMEFGNNLSIIIGSSDSGKSSIIRSMLSIFFKEKFYLRNGCTNGYVEIAFQNGTVIKREKTIKKDGTVSDNYTLNGVVFKKIGKHIPKQILEAIRIHPIELNDGSLLNLNVQTQHGGKFLLSDTDYSAGFRARVTSLSGSEVLDKASLAASTEHRAVKSKLTQNTDKTLPELNETIQSYSELLTINDTYKQLKLKQEQLVVSINKLDQVKSIKSKLDSIVPNTVHDYRDYIVRLNGLLNKLNILNILQKFKSISGDIVVPILPSTDTVDKLHQWMIKLKLLYTTCRQQQKMAMQNMSYKSLYQGWINQYNDLVAKGTNCPLCEQPLRSTGET